MKTDAELGIEFMAQPSEVMLRWIDANAEEQEWGWREYFDAGRMAVCMEVFTTLLTLKSVGPHGREYEYSLAVGALEGVLQRLGVEERVLTTYKALSVWRRTEAMREAYASRTAYEETVTDVSPEVFLRIAHDAVRGDGVAASGPGDDAPPL